MRSLGSLGKELCRRILSRPQSADHYVSPERARRDARSRQFIDDIGERYLGVGLSTFEVGSDRYSRLRQAALDRCVKLCTTIASDGLASQLGNIIFLGPSGTGKDHLMISMLKVVVQSPTLVCWRNGQSLYSEFRDLIGSNKTEAACLAPLIRASLLAISDPAPPKGDVSNYGTQLLYQVIEERYRHERPTWMTINATDRSEVERVLGTPIVSRLFHGAEVIGCEWPDFRAAKGKQ